jgi:hypothetical protein
VNERRAWDRQHGETSRAYAAFRRYRDAGPLRTQAATAMAFDVHLRTVNRWSARWDWQARAVAWDDEVHILEYARRLEAIRTLHDTHQRAARAALTKALAALAAIDAKDIPAGAAARLLELGTRLERETLLTSVEDLQGIARSVLTEDPWEAIARELQGGRTAWQREARGCSSPTVARTRSTRLRMPTSSWTASGASEPGRSSSRVPVTACGSRTWTASSASSSTTSSRLGVRSARPLRPWVLTDLAQRGGNGRAQPARGVGREVRHEPESGATGLLDRHDYAQLALTARITVIA